MNRQKEILEIQSKFKKNYVESVFFYQKNTTFFMVMILFSMIEAMAGNSVSDMPSMFLILLMAAFY